MQEEQLEISRKAYMIEVPRIIERAFAVPPDWRDGAAVIRFHLTGIKAENIELVTSKGSQLYVDNTFLAVEVCSFRKSPFPRPRFTNVALILIK